MAITVGDFLLQRLSEWGVRCIYGYPSNAINGVTGAFGRIANQMRFVHARHASLPAFVVWAHAKSSGKIGMCVAASCSSAIHLLHGFCDAKLDHPWVLASMGKQQRALTSRIPTLLEMEIAPEATRMVTVSCKEWEGDQLRPSKK